MTNQIKNTVRVADNGGVFTASREVNTMQDLVEHETLRIDSRFREPACGDSKFLAPVLERKLEVVKQRYGRVQFDFERNAIVAVSSV